MNTKEKAKWLSEFYAQVAEGGEAQILVRDKWLDMWGGQCGPKYPDWFNCNPDQWRIKPKLIPVDLSVLTKSGIDCEFWNVHCDIIMSIGSLATINRTDEYLMANNSGGLKPFDRCRPRMNHIHAWMGGKRSLPNGLQVKVYRKGVMGGIIDNVGDSIVGWNHSSNSDDIIAFEVIGLADGYCWPWEDQ